MLEFKLEELHRDFQSGFTTGLFVLGSDFMREGYRLVLECKVFRDGPVIRVWTKVN